MLTASIIVGGNYKKRLSLLQEEANRGKPNWEHLSEDLHVLIQCEDAPNRAVLKLKRAAAEVRKLLVPSVGFVFLLHLLFAAFFVIRLLKVSMDKRRTFFCMFQKQEIVFNAAFNLAVLFRL